MNSKAPLALMGQLLMVLFFSLAAAICLQAFAKSEALSIASENRDHAALYAQNAAETLKSTHGDLDRASAILGGSVGAVCGMRVFHHKTRHWYFRAFFPALLLVQAALLALGAYRLLG